MAGFPQSHAGEEVRSLIGKLLHLCEVVRPGRFFVGRMLDQLGLAPSQRWQDKWQSKLAASRGARASACGRGAHLVGSRVSRGRGILAVDRSVGVCGPLRGRWKRLSISFTPSVHRISFGQTLAGMCSAGTASSPVYGGGSMLTPTFELA